MRKDLRLLTMIKLLDEASMRAAAGVLALKDVLCTTQEQKDRFDTQFNLHFNSLRKSKETDLAKCPPYFMFEFDEGED